MPGHVDVNRGNRDITFTYGIEISAGTGVTADTCRPDPVTLFAARTGHRDGTLCPFPVAEARHPNASQFLPGNIRDIHVENGARPQHQGTLVLEQHPDNPGGGLVVKVAIVDKGDGIISWEYVPLYNA